MKCFQCGQVLDGSNNFCRNCGTPIPQTGPITQRMAENKTPPTVSRPVDPIKNVHGPLEMKAVGRSTLKCTLGLAILTPLVYFSTSLIAFFRGNNTKVVFDKTSIALYVGQIIVAGIFLVLLFTPVAGPREGKTPSGQIARDAFHQFLKGWAAIWVTWLLLYLFIAIIRLLAYLDIGVLNVGAQATVDFLNLANSVVFFYVFLVLDMPSVYTESDPDRDKAFRKGISIITSICFAVFLGSALNRLYPERPEIGVFMSGVIVAISMAYVFGRLDSHYMNVNRWTLFPLYLYAVIQVIGPQMIDFAQPVSKDSHQEFYQWLFFLLALSLKVYLYSVITYWLQNGFFEEYFNAASKYVETIRIKKNSPNVV